MKMTKRDLVLDFIEQFNKADCFSNGMCYWFAHILYYRFAYQGEMMYDPVANHFGCKINGCVYDITGDVSDAYNWMPWASYSIADRKHAKRIARDCIYKVPDGIKLCRLCDEAYDDEYGHYICPRDNGPREDDEVCHYE